MKTTRVLKAILIGAIAGAALFFIPFPFRFFFIFFLIFFAFRFFAFGRYRGNWRNEFTPYQFMHNDVYAERWRSMSDEERRAFLKKMEAELFASKPVTE
jgi:hypothetical protein